MSVTSEMTSVELAASDAAAETLSQQCPEDQTEEETLALAENAAYHAARTAGASCLTAAEVSQKVVAEMTWAFTAGMFA
jgi:hypothetical protein